MYQIKAFQLKTGTKVTFPLWETEPTEEELEDIQDLLSLEKGGLWNIMSSLYTEVS